MIESKLLDEIEKHTTLYVGLLSKAGTEVLTGNCPFCYGIRYTLAYSAWKDGWHCFNCHRGGGLKELQAAVKEIQDAEIAKQLSILSDAPGGDAA